MIGSLLHDVRHALRPLARSPGFTAIAVLSLGLGLGATTTVFSLIDAVQFRELPFREPERLVTVYQHSPELCAGCGVGTSWANYVAWRGAATTFELFEAYAHREWVLGGDEGAARVRGAVVTAGLFPELGASPTHGRGFTAEDDHSGSADVILLSDALWRSRFASDPEVVGRQLRLSGRHYTVVGVMPPGFAFPERAQLWIPATPALAGTSADDRGVNVIARLASGVSLERAAAEVAALGRRAAEERPASDAGWTAHVTTLHDSFTSEYRTPYLLFLATAAFVLLIVIANLAGLLLARGLARRHEMVVRLALGASRARIVRQLLTESILLGALGGLVGLAIAAWSFGLLRGFFEFLPYWMRIGLDTRVILFGALTAIASGALAGLAAALRASGSSLSGALREAGHTTTDAPTAGRVRATLIVAEVTLTVVLLAGAAFAVRTFRTVSRIDDLGWDTRGVLVAGASLPGGAPAAHAVIGARLIERLSGLPGVAGVGGLGFQPPSPTGTPVLYADELPVADALHRAWSITPGYFETAQVPLLAGRAIDARDRAGSAPVMVVNRELARRLWGSENPVGRQIRVGDGPTHTVVGWVENHRISPLARGPLAYAYVPFAQQPTTVLSLVIRAPAEVAGALRTAAAEVDPDLPIDNVQTAADSYAGWTRPHRLSAGVLGAFGLFALGLSLLGIYGIVAYSVHRRTREIGLRIALGATGKNVIALVLRQALTLVGIGLGVGLIGGVAFGRLAGAVIPGLLQPDPILLAAVAVVMLAATTLAAVLPALRVTRIDPLAALRAE